ncbi:hypothetical protein, partial [Larkinella punicea]|uniref:hypothetical protein n=1 Tax=Larkinella punicea TaxID=2315727 RepID=UPI001CA3FFAB
VPLGTQQAGAGDCVPKGTRAFLMAHCGYKHPSATRPTTPHLRLHRQESAKIVTKKGKEKRFTNHFKSFVQY